MKQVLKKAIGPLFLGACFYLFILLGNNSQWISHDTSKTLTAIFAGAMLMYLIVYAAIYDRASLGIAGIGYSVMGLLLGIGIPVYMVLNQVFFTEHKKKPKETFFEKNHVTIIPNNSECHKIKYGTFVYGIDTIRRFSENNIDYELNKVYGTEAVLHRIKWLDSCSYLRLERNSSVLDYVRLGNFDGENHQMYIRPASTNSQETEKIKTITTSKE